MVTVEEIYENMKSIYREKTGASLSDSGDMAVRMYASAAQIYSLYAYNDWILRQCFPQTADGEYLDRHAALRGMTRREGSRAVGTVTFTASDLSASDRLIPRNTVCYTQYGTRFAVTEDTVLAAGEISVDAPCRCETVGIGGNVAADTVLYMAVCPIGIVSCTNDAPFTGGEDRETDALLRERVVQSYRSLPNGANEAYYEEIARGNPAVAAVRVLPKSRGLGTVDIVITSREGVPDAALLAAVQNSVDEKREMCVDAQVLAPSGVNVLITAEIEPKAGYAFDAVKDAVMERIETYFDGTLLGRDILLAEIGDIIYKTEGVRNYRITYPFDDTETEPDELPILNTLTITQMGE